MATRSEPYTLTDLINTTHIHDVYERSQRVPEARAVREAQERSVVLSLQIDEPQGEGVLLWRRGEELPQLLYFEP